MYNHRRTYGTHGRAGGYAYQLHQVIAAISIWIADRKFSNIFC